MAAPNRSPKTTCETCELRAVDFTEPANDSINVPETAVRVAREGVVQSHADTSDTDAPHEALDATRACVAHILAGSCVKYSTILGGEIVARRKRTRFWR